MLMQAMMQVIGDGGVRNMTYFLFSLESSRGGEMHWLGFMVFGLAM
jgi:hypothetical protein